MFLKEVCWCLAVRRWA